NINIKGMSTVSDYNVRIEPYGSVGLVQRETPQEGYINFTGNLINYGQLGVAAGSTIEVAGDYAQEDSGNLYIAVAGTGQNQYSRLVVSGDAQLGGGLNVSIDDDNYTPHFGDYFPFLTATGEASGTFNEIYYNNQNQGYNVGYNLDAGEAARLIYSAGAKTFTNVGGDLDWATDSNWSDSSKPGTGDHVLLSSGYAVTHSTGEDTITALTISSGNNSLNISGGSLNVSGNTVVDGELTVSGGGAAYLQHTSGTGKLSLSGDGVLFLYSGAEIAHYNQTGGTLMTFDDFTVTDSITASGGSVSGAPITDLYFTQKQGDFTLGSSINYFDKITIMVPNGKLTLDEQIQLGDVILQTGEAFINNVGANALQTNGTWQVWSVDPALDTLNGLSYDFKQYNAYRTDSEHSDVLGSGNGLFYTLAPTIGINLQGTVSKTYDGTDAAQLYMDNFAYTGLIGSDTVSNPEYYNAVYNNKNAGTGKTVTIDNLEIAITDNGKPVYGYGGTSTSVSGDIGEITKADLQITNGIAQHKTYDGTTAADVSNSTINALANDDVTLSAANAFFSDKNAGANKNITTAYTISGDDAGNYNLIQQSGLRADITKADLQIANGIAQNKTYDGTTVADVSSSTISALANDDVTLSAANAFFSDKNAGENKNITTAYTISGDDADNYNLIQQSGLTADITKADLQITNGIAQHKTYDGTTAADVSNSTINALANDDVTLSAANAFFSDKNAGANKNITTAYTISGNDADNYNLIQQSGLTADITKADLQIANGIAQNKTYDGTTAADVSNSTINALANDDVTLSAANAFFSDKNAGANKNITTAYTISGDDAVNYNLIQQSGLTADITPKELIISGITAQDKEYDGTTNAQVDTSHVIFDGLVSGDNLTITASGQFEDANAGENKNVNLTSEYGGTDKNNYSITGQQYAKASITEVSTQPPVNPDPGIPDPDPAEKPTPPAEEQAKKQEQNNVTSQISKETQEQPTSAVAPAGLELVGMVADESGEAAGSGGNVSDSTGDAATSADDEDQEKQEAREEQQSTQEQQAEKPAKNYCN
ncbi:MAG: YDG domain-containing protein, partial [Trichlorobacter sp.]|nr:YDG domain-containing protein [Trichlorobacter sp.]